MAFITPVMAEIISAIESSKSVEQLTPLHMGDLFYRFDGRLTIHLSRYAPCSVAVDGFDLFDEVSENDFNALKAALVRAVAAHRAALVSSLKKEA